MSSRIELEWPDEPSFRALGRLVLGGVAARANVPVDRVDELGLALDTLVVVPATTRRLHLGIDVVDHRLHSTLGVFATDPLAEPGIRRVVAALVDHVGSTFIDTGYEVALTVEARQEERELG